MCQCQLRVVRVSINGGYGYMIGQILTLIVMILMCVVPIQLVQKLDNIRVAVGAGELIASAVEAEDELVGLSWSGLGF